MAFLPLLLSYWKPLGAVFLCLALFGAGYLKGHQRASAACQAAELRLELAARDKEIARLRARDGADAAQSAAEIAAAAERQKALDGLKLDVESLRAEQGRADLTQAALEADLVKLSATKEAADELIARLRAARLMDCRASDRDVAADRGMFRHR